MINYEENADANGSKKEIPANVATENGVHEKGIDENEPESYVANGDNTKNKGVWYNARTKCWLACVKGSGRHLRVFSVKKHGFKTARMLALECKNSTVINLNPLAKGAAKGETNGKVNAQANGEANGGTSQAGHAPSGNVNGVESTLPQSNGVYAKLKNEPRNYGRGRTRTYSYNEAGGTHHAKLEAQESMDIGSLATINSENASAVTNASISASASANGAEEGPERRRRYNTRRGSNKSLEELNKKEGKNEKNEDDTSFYKASNNSSVSPATSRGYNMRGNYNNKGNLNLKGSSVTKGSNSNNMKRNSSTSKGYGGSPKGGSNNLRGATPSKVSQGRNSTTRGAGTNGISKGQQPNGNSFHNTEGSSYTVTRRSSRNYNATTDKCNSSSLTVDEVNSYKEKGNHSVQTQNGKRQSETLVETLDGYEGDNRKRKKTTKDKFSYLVRKDNGGDSNGGDPAVMSTSAYHEGSNHNDHNNTTSHATQNTHNTRNTRSTRNSGVQAAQLAQKGQNGQGKKNSHDDFQNVGSLNTRSSATQNYQHGTHNEGYNNVYDGSYDSAYHRGQLNQQNASNGSTYHKTRSSHNTRSSNNTGNSNSTRSSNNACIITDQDFQVDSPEETNENFYFIKPMNYEYSDNIVYKERRNKGTNKEKEYNIIFSNDCYSDYCSYSQNKDECKANFIDLTREALSLILQDLKKNVIPKIPVGIEKRERYINSLRLCLKSAKFTKHINELEPYLELFSECIKNSKLPSHMDLKDQLFYLDKL
ncbi:AP2 family [Plasmodium coatneyi]|uniref:AP2 family n=1 Tax=Plasmodium coatneyi TaxID=208452 RepID=A0A1B1E366_9APIC|nr:AP2 family [Plasmodium coatneyi]ANQ09435.1 AP2 family [Plasmodium coatneyi]